MGTWGIDDPRTRARVHVESERRAPVLRRACCVAAVFGLLMGACTLAIDLMAISGWRRWMLYGVASFAAAGLNALWVRRDAAKVQRAVLTELGRCTDCGYLLKAGQQRCPECGRPRDGACGADS